MSKLNKKINKIRKETKSAIEEMSIVDSNRPNPGEVQFEFPMVTAMGEGEYVCEHMEATFYNESEEFFDWTNVTDAGWYTCGTYLVTAQALDTSGWPHGDLWREYGIQARCTDGENVVDVLICDPEDNDYDCTDELLFASGNDACNSLNVSEIETNPVGTIGNSTGICDGEGNIVNYSMQSATEFCRENNYDAAIHYTTFIATVDTFIFIDDVPCDGNRNWKEFSPSSIEECLAAGGPSNTCVHQFGTITCYRPTDPAPVLEDFQGTHWNEEVWYSDNISSFIQSGINQNVFNDWFVEQLSTEPGGGEYFVRDVLDSCPYPLESPCEDIDSSEQCMRCGCVWREEPVSECRENLSLPDSYAGQGTTINNAEIYPVYWSTGCHDPSLPWEQQMCPQSTGYSIGDIGDLVTSNSDFDTSGVMLLNNDTWIAQYGGVDVTFPFRINENSVLEIDAFLLHEGEIQGFGIATMNNDGTVGRTLRYIFWGRQGWYNPTTYEWSYQAWYPWHEWITFRLAVGEDWLRKYGDTDVEIEAFIYFNDNDFTLNNVPTGSVGKILFDNVVDWTKYNTPDPTIIRVGYEIDATETEVTINYELEFQILCKDNNWEDIPTNVVMKMNDGLSDDWEIMYDTEIHPAEGHDGLAWVIFPYSKTYSVSELSSILIRDTIRPMFIVEQQPGNTYDTSIKRAWQSVLVDMSDYNFSDDDDGYLNINWTGDTMMGRRMECLEYECTDLQIPSGTAWGGAWECDEGYPWTCPVDCIEGINDFGVTVGQCNYYWNPDDANDVIISGTCESAGDCYIHLECQDWNYDNCLRPGVLTEYPPEYLTDQIVQYFPEDDLNIVNMETVLTDFPTEDMIYPRVNAHPRKTYVLGSHPDTISALTNMNVDAVSLANNHVMDYMVEGMQQTLDTLDSVGIEYSGCGYNTYEAYQPLFLNRKQKVISLIAVTDRTGQQNGSWSMPYQNSAFNHPGVAFPTDYDMQKAIDSVKPHSDLVVVELHWGEEYVHFTPDTYTWMPWEEHEWIPDPDYSGSFSPGPVNPPHYRDIRGNEYSDNNMSKYHTDEYLNIMETENIMLGEDEDYNVYASMGGGFRTRNLKKKYIEMGADMVIAHHPHVLQGFEWFDGSFIAHSLGNFLFDQNFPETMISVIVQTGFDKDVNLEKIKLIPIHIDRYRPKRATGEFGRRILEDLAHKSRIMNTYVDIYPDIDINKVHDGEPHAYVLKTNNPTDITNIRCRFSNEPNQSVLTWLNENDHLNSWQRNFQSSPWWLSHALKFPRNGSLSRVNSINISSEAFDEEEIFNVLRYRVGKSILWYGNNENEGSTLWDAKHPLYDDYEYSSEEYNNDLTSHDGFGEWSIHHLRISENYQSAGTMLKQRLVGRLVTEHTHATEQWGSLSGPSFTVKGRYWAYGSGGIQVQLKCFRTRQGSSIYNYTVFPDAFVPEDSDGQDWTYFENNFELNPECNFINIKLSSWPLPPDEDFTYYSWTYFDDIDIIHWDEEWYSSLHNIGFQTPNDYHYLQFGINNENEGYFEEDSALFTFDEIGFSERMYHDPTIEHRDFIQQDQHCHIINHPIPDWKQPNIPT